MFRRPRVDSFAVPARPRQVVLLAMLAALTVLALVTATASARPSAARATATVATAKGKLGAMLVGPNGHALYLFLLDKHGKSACYGTCAKYWPPLTTSATPKAGHGVKASLLGTVRRTNGTLQVTYDKHPLYYFVEDKKAGMTKGEGVVASGAKWYLVKPGGAKLDND